MTNPLINLQNINVDFKQKHKITRAINNVSLKINKGDIYGIVGYSGAGKSTLVRVINRLQKPTSGKILIKNNNILNFSKHDIRKVRKNISVVFQHFNLMDSRTIADNVAFPLLNSGLNRAKRKARVGNLLNLVGLSDKADVYPAQLSGGQKQRVAIARALANNPEILISDEATSALDPKNTQDILSLLKKLNKTLNLTVVLITHEMDAVKSICNKVAVMDEGKVIEHGDILKIFSYPEKKLTQDFINTTNQVNTALKNIKKQDWNNNNLYELKYLGSTTNNPIIINLYKKYNVEANIIFGNIELIKNTPIGHLIITLSGNEESIKQAKEYLSQQDIVCKKIIIQSNQEKEGVYNV